MSDPILERMLGRRDFLKLGAIAAGTGILAACGGEEEEEAAPAEEAPAAEAATEAAATEEAAPAQPPIEEEPGDLEVLEWAGYEVPDLFKPYVDAGYPTPKFTFLTDDDQALAKVRAGFHPDVVHPCLDYVNDWVATGVVQPWDTSLIPNWANLNPQMVAGGQVDGKQYFVPLDWGFSAPLYRADKVEPGEDSWNIYFDERYAGKISWWDSIYSVIVGGFALGAGNPWDMTDEEIAQVKDFMIERKGVVRNFWQSQTDMEADFAAGNIWITYAWPATVVNMKAKGLDVVYMQPKEGRISWVCGLVLLSDTENYHHAHAFADAWAAPASGEWMIANYAYGHSNTQIDLGKIDPGLVKAFSLDDPTILEEPRTHIVRWVPRRKVYNKTWDEIKAA